MVTGDSPEGVLLIKIPEGDLVQNITERDRQRRNRHQERWRRSLGHKRPGMRGIYFKAHLLAQRRPMMQRWADYLDELRQNNS